MITTTILVLSETEDARLARNETRISQGLASFVEVGEALSDIRDARLYRATHGTFESYCADRWNMTKGRVYQLIGAKEMMSTIVDKSAITTESQARELARVEPARREEVIRKADLATGGKITAAAIKEAAAPAKEIVVTVEDAAPATDVRTTPRSEPYVMPPRGMFLARGAIAELEKIQPKDGERVEAFTYVAEWCKGQLKKQVAAPVGERSPMTEARELWMIAKGRLDNIRRNDPERENVLEQVIKYAQQRLDKQAAAPAKGGVVTVEPTMAVLHPLPPHVISAESLAAGDAADAESEKLWLLKSTWRKTNKKDRAAFIEWGATAAR
jgi:hypothetical protein